MNIEDQLDPQIYMNVKIFCSQGDELLEKQLYKESISEYNKAWKLIPPPKNHWNASTWILTAIGDACYLGGFREKGISAFEYVMTCPNAIGNPFIHLRYGQLLYDSGDYEHAANELIRAFMAEGEDIFLGEDNKYLDFLKTKADIS